MWFNGLFTDKKKECPLKAQAIGKGFLEEKTREEKLQESENACGGTGDGKEWVCLV